MNSLTIIERADKVQLAQQLAEDVAESLQQGQKARGSASLVVSGGSTPYEFFDALTQKELDWRNVAITLADERCVPIDHPDRNEKMVKERLLLGEVAPARFLSLLEDQPQVEHPDDCRKTEQHCSTQLASVAKPFDVVILGMGEDAHTASLFPAAEGLSDALDPENPALCQIIDPLHAPHRRISLTLSALTDAHRVILHITGSKKRQVLDEAMQNEDVLQAPIAAVLRHAAIRSAQGENQQRGVVLYSTV